MKLAGNIAQQDLDLFLEETGELLQLLESDISKLRVDGSNTSLLQEALRASHNLKGCSAMLGHRQMALLADIIESILERLCKGQLSVTPKLVDVLLHIVDELKKRHKELISFAEINC